MIEPTDRLDPWVERWMVENPMFTVAPDEFTDEMLGFARTDVVLVRGPEVARVTDEVVAGVPIRIYEPAEAARGVVVYFHGGGFCTGSLGFCDNVARELAVAAGAVVMSVGYRLAPEHPYPAGLDDGVAVTEWALANVQRFGVGAGAVVAAGESAGGTLAAAVALRLRDAGGLNVAGQALLYPVMGTDDPTFASRREFDGLFLSARGMQWFWDAYTGGAPVDDDPYAAPLRAPSMARLPAALVVLGGCDVLRDEGRQYAERLIADGVEAQEACWHGQPHGFLNFGSPAAHNGYRRIGAWIRDVFSGI